MAQILIMTQNSLKTELFNESRLQASFLALEQREGLRAIYLNENKDWEDFFDNGLDDGPQSIRAQTSWTRDCVHWNSDFSSLLFYTDPTTSGMCRNQTIDGIEYEVDVDMYKQQPAGTKPPAGQPNPEYEKYRRWVITISWFNPFRKDPSVEESKERVTFDYYLAQGME